MKKIVITVVCLALLFGLCACSSNKPVSRHLPEEGATTYEVTGTLQVENADDKITVIFENDLITGTVTEVAVYAYDGEKLYSENYSITGKTVKMEIEKKAEWKGKKVYVSVTASPSTGRQPSEVRDAYGRLFQNVTGSNLIWDRTENIIFFQSEEIEL
ncbi:MAG: hypothetical protein II749_04895 [Clostridia bacterium]|nr:hypothetical protein [Clostridia bacterium]